MLCTNCGTHNPDTNKFCGSCGSPLVHTPEPVTVAPQEREHYHPISGPSLLGLDGPEEDDTTTYLLDDESHHRSHAGWLVFSALAILILGGIGYFEWQAIKTGKLNIPGFSSTTAEAPKPADQPVAASIPATNTQANPQSDHSEDNVSATAPTDSTNDNRVGTASKPWGATTGSDKPASAAEDEKTTHDSMTQATKDANQRREKVAEDNGSEASADADEKSDDEQVKDNKDSDTKTTASASAGHSAAEPPKPDPRQNKMLLTGERYLYGRGAPQDCRQAVMYFEIAARDYDNGPAMSHLGAMYAAGQCVRQDRQLAYKWFTRAQQAEPKNQWLSRNMNMVWREMTPEERAKVSR